MYRWICLKVTQLKITLPPGFSILWTHTLSWLCCYKKARACISSSRHFQPQSGVTVCTHSLSAFAAYIMVCVLFSKILWYWSYSAKKAIRLTTVNSHICLKLIKLSCFVVFLGKGDWVPLLLTPRLKPARSSSLATQGSRCNSQPVPVPTQFPFRALLG